MSTPGGVALKAMRAQVRYPSKIVQSTQNFGSMFKNVKLRKTQVKSM